MLVNVLSIVIRRFIIKRFSAKFAWNVFRVNQNLIGTIEHIQVKNLMCVLLVIKDLQQSRTYKIIRQFIVMRENSSAWYALTTEVSRQKMNWLNTWYVIMNQNSRVQSVVRNVIHHVVWINTWSFILNRHIRVKNVKRNFTLHLVWNDMKNKTLVNCVSIIVKQ